MITRIKLGRRLVLGPGAIVLAFLAAGTARPDQAPALRWSVEVVLAVTGNYRVADKDGVTTGDYSFTVRWTGTIERDDQDWKLRHDKDELTDWKAEEQPAPRSLGLILTTEDFTEKPVFRFHYILQDEGLIELDFGMESFSIPLNPSQEKFLLILPASAHTTQPGPGLDYDHSLVKGSNRVAFDEKELLSSPLKKTFDWSWRRSQVALWQDMTIYCNQSHQAHLTASFKPIGS